LTLYSRRQFLRASATAGGGLLLAFRLPGKGNSRSGAAGVTEVFAPNAFIRISPSAPISLTMPQAEMGQGIHTAHAMIIAEELDVNLTDVQIEASPPSDALYGNPIFHIQVTGNSNSVRAFFLPLRNAGATARALLVEAAAQLWEVEWISCRTAEGMVIHDASARQMSYGSLATRAAGITLKGEVKLKSPKDFKLIGSTAKRLDTPHKVNGGAVYGIDVLPNNVQFAVLAACPVFGGKVQHADVEAARRIPGVRHVVVLDDLVSVIGDHTWAAKQGLKALQPKWQEDVGIGIDSASIWRQMAKASEQSGTTAITRGDVDQALVRHERLEATYQLPLLAHATMEPMNCTVHVRKDACEVWAGSQVQARAQAVAAQITGLPIDQVIFHNQLLGCGLGRRLEVDMVEKAVRIAQQVPTPVKVIWSREEDIQHDAYRPAYYDRLTASVQNGKILAWNHRITGSAVFARWFPPAYTHNIDIDGVDSAVDMPYEIPNFRVQFVREEPANVPTGFWRGVGPNNNVFAVESFIDEIAAYAGQDPVHFRLSLLDKTPRLKAALECVTQQIGWSNPLPPGVGRGVSVQPSFGSFLATAIELEVDPSGEIHLRRIASAVDTGIRINPDTIEAQIQGGLIVGLTAALYGNITIRDGRVEQSNFHDYRMLRINEIPSIEVHTIPSDEPPGGVGEAGTTSGSAALCNAIFAATGVRVRRLPVDRALLVGKRRA
jgi:isoquinoline 1-oxidoreductase beta subunit